MTDPYKGILYSNTHTAITKKELLIHATQRMNLKIIMLSEKSQTGFCLGKIIELFKVVAKI